MILKVSKQVGASSFIYFNIVHGWILTETERLYIHSNIWDRQRKYTIYTQLANLQRTYIYVPIRNCTQYVMEVFAAG